MRSRRDMYLLCLGTALLGLLFVFARSAISQEPYPAPTQAQAPTATSVPATPVPTPTGRFVYLPIVLGGSDTLPPPPTPTPPPLPDRPTLIRFSLPAFQGAPLFAQPLGPDQILLIYVGFTRCEWDDTEYSVDCNAFRNRANVINRTGTRGVDITRWVFGDCLAEKRPSLNNGTAAAFGPGDFDTCIVIGADGQPPIDVAAAQALADAPDWSELMQPATSDLDAIDWPWPFDTETNP